MLGNLLVRKKMYTLVLRNHVVVSAFLGFTIKTFHKMLLFTVYSVDVYDVYFFI